MGYFMDLVIVGLSLGMIYGLVAIGISLIYSGLDVVRSSICIDRPGLSTRPRHATAKIMRNPACPCHRPGLPREATTPDKIRLQILKPSTSR